MKVSEVELDLISPFSSDLIVHQTLKFAPMSYICIMKYLKHFFKVQIKNIPSRNFTEKYHQSIKLYQIISHPPSG